MPWIRCRDNSNTTRAIETCMIGVRGTISIYEGFGHSPRQLSTSKPNSTSRLPWPPVAQKRAQVAGHRTYLDGYLVLWISSKRADLGLHSSYPLFCCQSSSCCHSISSVIDYGKFLILISQILVLSFRVKRTVKSLYLHSFSKTSIGIKQWMPQLPFYSLQFSFWFSIAILPLKLKLWILATTSTENEYSGYPTITASFNDNMSRAISASDCAFS